MRVFDVDGNLPLNSRNQGLIVENRKAGIGKLTHLTVGHRADRLRIVDYVWISGEDCIHVGKVFIQSRVKAPGQDRAGNVRAAP